MPLGTTLRGYFYPERILFYRNGKNGANHSFLFYGKMMQYAISSKHSSFVGMDYYLADLCSENKNDNKTNTKQSP